MKKYKTTLCHSLLVGFIAALFFIISGWLSVATWVVFFAWANYFLHESDMKKALKLMLALFIGIVIAFLASHVMDFVNRSVQSGDMSLYINGGIIFVVATFLVFLECMEGWGDFVPATFLGTVLFYALGLKVPGTSLGVILLQLMLPLGLGIIAGYLTIVSRAKLGQCLEKQIAD